MKEGYNVPYFYTCPYCGAHNDPGEKCTCQEENEPELIPDKPEIITIKGKNKDLKVEAQTYKFKF
nr:MAG TPA: cysteine-rich protein [Caudoviricetes sp.]